MTWEEWQDNFWGTHKAWRERTLEIDGKYNLTFLRMSRNDCLEKKLDAVRKGVEGLEILAPNERGNTNANHILIQHPEKVPQKVQYTNLLD